MHRLLTTLFVFFVALATSASAQDKILKFAYDDPPRTLLTYKMVGLEDTSFGANLFAGLTTSSAEGEIIGGLAEKWEVMDGSTRFLFYLRPNLKWSDDTPMTAEAIRESFLGLLKNPASTPGSLLPLIVGAQDYRDGLVEADAVGLKVVDDNVLEFTLTQPSRTFPALLSVTTNAPAPTHLVDVFDPEFELEPTTDFAFSGPFILTEVMPEKKYTAVRNPNFYDPKRLKLDGYEYYVIEKDFAAAVKKIETGELHIARILAPKNNEFYDRYLEPFTVNFETNIVNYMVFNTIAAPFDNKNIRKAVAMATDPELGGMIEQNNSYVPLASLVPPVSSTYPGDVFAEWDLWTMEKRLENAKALLAEEGYDENNRLTVEIALIDHPAHIWLGNALKAMWAAVNIDAEFKFRGISEHFDSLRAQDFQIGRAGILSSISDPHMFLTLLETGHSSNYGMWSNTEFDRLIVDAQRTVDPEEAKALQRQALAIAREETVWIPLYGRSDSLLRNPRVKGILSQTVPDRSFQWYDLEDE